MARREDLKTVTVGLEREQYAALREEALRRSVRDGGSADASAVIRELVTAWMKRGARKEG
jgi:Arc/MetJ-type ribon-helix-helix transcriptional regulator